MLSSCGFKRASNNTMKNLRKALIPAAGMGTRFLPATKAIPKEMLPLVDKPTVQYVVEEAVQSGFKDVIFVTGRNKTEIEDHFDYDYRLEKELEARGKKDLLRAVRDISEMIAVTTIRQKKPMGLGHAVLCGETVIGDEPFGVFLGDDIIVHQEPCMSQLMRVFDRHQATVLAVQEVSWESASLYGLVAVQPVEEGDGRLFKVTGLVEKPPREKAPSNLAIIGRYVLTPRIFTALRETEPGAGGEIQLTDGLRSVLQDEPIYAYRFEGKRYDAGNKLEFLIATVELALQREDLGEDFRDYLKSLKL